MKTASLKPATIKEIADIMKVSVSTVSRGLHDHPSIGLITRQKIKKLAKELNYEPNQTAIFLQKGSTQTIGVIVPELSESFFSSAITAIEETAHRRNFTVLFAQSHDDEKLEKQLVQKMKNHRVDGLLVSVCKNSTDCRHFDSLKNYNIPVVFFDRIPTMPNIHYVACDMETGTIEAVTYLLKKGHRTIVMINGPNTITASGERREGYIKAMTKNRLKFDPALIATCDLTESGTVKAFDMLMAGKRKPTAIVTFNDYIALFIIKHARSMNLEIGKDIEIVSYANLPMIDYMETAPSASVEQFPYLQGQKAIDILLDLLTRKDKDTTDHAAYYKIIIDSQLVERKLTS